ncbi:MAG: hypothetical protein HETSPECPRED_008544 [Heterodermia speciosa]|uniref:Uncharacterized protein n=1 Tax=Heterodermia speciosa TaxID=116794 RepID=A0A8H3FYC9_9LECA|nr:MAG: hypothetical protein HETSPECPRED_008544 [Heterodermia speciosa]
MKSLLLSLVACSLLSPVLCDQNPDFDSSQSASGWYFVRFNLPAGEQLTSVTGEMIVPPLEPTNGGTYYIWPGLETSTYDGIYQNVLSGTDSGTWAYFSGYCCTNPTLPWSDNLFVYEGQTLSYRNVLTDTTWATTQGNIDTGEVDNNSFDALVGKTFQSAVFAIELYSESWNFGPMTFQNIAITGTGSDASWCNETPENWQNGADYTISDLSATVDDFGVTCNIGSIVLNQPAAPAVKARTVTKTSSATVTPTPTGNAGVRTLPASGVWGCFSVLLLVFCSL